MSTLLFVVFKQQKLSTGVDNSVDNFIHSLSTGYPQLIHSLSTAYPQDIHRNINRI
jgi:hypothetical protein